MNVLSEEGAEWGMQVMPGGNTRTSLFATPFPVTLSRGEGCRVWDRDGCATDLVHTVRAAFHGTSTIAGICF